MNKPESLHIRKTAYSPDNKHTITVILEPVFNRRSLQKNVCRRMPRVEHGGSGINEGCRR